jgi:hypothetical protein
VTRPDRPPAGASVGARPARLRRAPDVIDPADGLCSLRGSSPDCAGALTSAGHNVIGNDGGCTLAPAAADQIGTAGSPLDPKLGPLANNGGYSQTHALLGGSPAIDTGGSTCASTDQRGFARPAGTACDIGAF